MDVVCGRCRAEYEFDDALISERGTTVRCTNCGLQFKVFPPVGQRAPEIWRVYHPTDRRVEPVEYASLRDLQKAIARGEVKGDQMLARGSEEPRSLAEIVELQPLLQQPRSEPPPPSGNSPEVEVPPAPPTGMPGGSGTVLGVNTRPDPAAVKASRAALPPPAARATEEPTPSADPPSTAEQAEPAPQPTEPQSDQAGVAPSEANESKPKIRSALSIGPPSAAASPSQAPAAEEAPDSKRASIPPPRQSLRSTLSGSFPTPSQAGVPPSTQPVTENERAPESSPAEESAAPPPVEPAPRKNSPPPAITPPIEPEISDSGEFAGQMTPTPSGMRAYRSPDAQPVSSVAGVPVKRRARSGGIVLAVVLGGAAFLGFANRDRLSAMLEDGKTEPAPTTEEKKKEVSADLRLRLEMADVAWISDTLLETPDSQFDGGPPAGDLQLLEKELSDAGAEVSWHMVNLHRAQGDFGQARSLAGKLGKGAEQSYALALLDLAEGGESPPWPVILQRLKEAATGERGRFLARSVYVYSLAASGDVARAKADLSAFEKLAGASDSPLFQELGQYLDSLEPEEAGAEQESPAEEEPPAEPEAPEEPAPEEPAPEEAPEPAEEAKPQPKEKKPEPPPAPKPVEVSDAVKAKVAQADSMWRGGNQDGALTLYRQVVAEIGTKHFLGQRSAARIRQAEREKAGGQ